MLDHVRLPSAIYLNMDHPDHLYPFAGNVLVVPVAVAAAASSRRVRVAVRVGEKTSLNRPERPCRVQQGSGGTTEPTMIE